MKHKSLFIIGLLILLSCQATAQNGRLVSRKQIDILSDNDLKETLYDDENKTWHGRGLSVSHP